jgi:F-type H+/Na+-transporting ATPase subunit alpha
MRKVAGRLKLDLSQYRELEAFAQFGSDLDVETQRTLARGDRLVATLNQNERQPLSVEEQVVQIFAGMNGYLDRIKVERVTEFLTGLTERAHAEAEDLLEKIAGGDWSDETQQALDKLVSEFADDFGYDLDEEGQPMDEGESDRVSQRDQDEEKRDEDKNEDKDGGSDEEDQEGESEDAEKETAEA